MTESDLVYLVQNNGVVHFMCGGWECQSMSMAGKHKGMDDERFEPFLDMVKILNFLQTEQYPMGNQDNTLMLTRLQN